MFHFLKCSLLIFHCFPITMVGQLKSVAFTGLLAGHYISVHLKGLNWVSHYLTTILHPKCISCRLLSTMVGDGLMQWQLDSHVVIVSQLHSAFFLVLISGFLFFFAPVFSLAIFCIITTRKSWFSWKKRSKFASFWDLKIIIIFFNRFQQVARI